MLSRSKLGFEDAGFIFDGKRYRQRWILPDLAAEPRVGDIVQIAFDLVNSYDGTTTFGLAFNMIRLVCQNGMMIEHVLGGFKFRHFGHDNFSAELDQAAVQVRDLADRLEPVANRFQKLIDRPIDRQAIQQAFRDLKISQSLQAETFMRIDEDSAWGLYNAFTGALTEANTHRAENINRQESRYMLN